MLTDPQALRATSDAVAAAAEALAAVGDAAGEAKGHFVHATALARLGKIGACEAALDRALAAARRVNDRRRVNAVLAVAPLAALWGPSPVTRASGRCLDVVRVLRITQGAPAVEAVALRCQAVLEALRGRTEAARRMITSSRRMVEELGITQGLLETEMFAGHIELIEGDTAAAEHSLRAAYEGLRTHGLGIDAARAAALLGITLLAQGRAAEAEALSHESEGLAGDDLQAAITWRRVRAEALARRGMHAAAVDLARAAVDIAAATDALLHHADARLALTAALRAAGRDDEAPAEEAHAIELWEAKGATVLAERARRAAGRAAQVAQPPADRGAPARPVRRHVRANAATVTVARFDAAFVARDAGALPNLVAEEIVDHTTGVTYDGQGALASWRLLLSAQDPKCRHEPLATLGDSLALCRQSLSASRIGGGEFDVGAYERETIILFQVDAQGRRPQYELFADDRLGDAVARLYERYAELLPDGPERVRAAATARSVAIVMGPLEPDRWPFAPAIEFVDHRTVGLGSVHGAQALRHGIHALLDLSEDFVTRLDDVLALRSDALLVRWTNFGTDRASGGAFERDLCQLLVFGRDGLVTRWEQREAERDDEALARFEELVPSSEQRRGVEGLMAEPAARSRAATRIGRRVRPNAATATVARIEAAVAARDAEALTARYADDAQHIDHPNGAVYDQLGFLSAIQGMWSASDLTYRHEPLASLGESLALTRVFVSASAAARGVFDIAAFEADRIGLDETDAQGRVCRDEVFAPGQLSDAVARLYERYAELLPDGPERARAAATARAVAALREMPDLDRFATVLAPDIQAVDHRNVGWGALRGAEAALDTLRALRELTADWSIRFDDVLALRPDVLVACGTNTGTQRGDGGAFERPVCALVVFGGDGRIARWEQFDVEHEAEALARFDELAPSVVERREGEPPGEPWAGRSGSAGPLRQGSGQASPSQTGLPSRAAEQRARRVRANAATANAAQTDTAIAARDGDTLPTLFADELEVVDHTTGATYDRRGFIATWRSLLSAQDPTCRHEPLATLGDALALHRLSTSATGFAGGKFDVAAYERQEIILTEVDAHGRRRRVDIFGPDRLGDAVARLYERYADLLPDGPVRARAATTARSAATMGDADRWTSAVGGGVEFVDHRTVGIGSVRGADGFTRVVGSLREVADDLAARVDDILSLRSDAYLVAWTNFGTDRTSGGAFERNFLLLSVHGTEGLPTHVELFDVDRDAEAFARFDALTPSDDAPAPFAPSSRPPLAAYRGAEPPAAPSRAAEKRARRVRANAATAHAVRLDAAIAARDADALPTLCADESEVVDHATGTTYDRAGTLATWRALLRAQDPMHRHEALATLGDSLALCRLSTSASGFTGRKFDVGAYEREEIVLIEADANGRRRRSEYFAADRLGDAVVRLYQRYADLLPDGLERARAAATARAFGALLGPFDLHRYATAVAPAVEYTDHRTIRGRKLVPGAEALLRALGVWLELADDISIRVDDVLDLRPGALIVRETQAGTVRATGGAYERQFLQLLVFGTDGLVARWENFEAERENEALARFDELSTSYPRSLGGHPGEERGVDSRLKTAGMMDSKKRQRRLQANAATAHAARACAAVGARDAAAVRAEVADEIEVVDHTTGTTYDRQGYLATMDVLLRAENPAVVHEPLATLGDSLLLSRCSTSASGFVGGKFDVGAYEKEEIDLIEVDAQGRRRRGEIFATDRLGDAITRLYERYAELLADGPARTHAAATARSVAAILGPFDPDRWATAFAPAIEVVDNRTLGTWSARGVEALLQHFRSLREVAADVAMRVDDILSLRPDAFLVRRTNFGTDRAGGGAYERQFLVLYVVGADGLMMRMEFFDTERDDEALARFDELARSTVEGLSAEPPATARITNAATRSMHQFKDALEARDWGRVAAVLAPEFRYFDRRTMMHLDLDRDQYLEFLRPNWQMSSAGLTQEILATRGNRLALLRSHFEGSDHTIGPSEIEFLCVAEVNDHGVRVATVMFDPDDLDAAYAELDARYAAGEAAPYARTWETLQRFARAAAARDWEELASVFDPDLVIEDHRLIGWGTLHSRDDYLARIRALVDLAPDVTMRVDHVLALDHGVTLGVGRAAGSREGGPFEIPSVSVLVLDSRGRIQRSDNYNLEQLDAARARFEELRPALRRPPADVPDPSLIPPNAAVAFLDRIAEPFEARDWGAFRALASDDFTYADRGKRALVSGDVEVWIASLQFVADVPGFFERELIGTVGDRIAVERMVWTGEPDTGAFEIESISLVEVDANGRLVAWIDFDPDDRRAAFAEAQARFVAGEAAAIGGQAPIVVLVRAFARHDWETLRGCLADNLVFRDHRTPGLLGVLRPDEWVESMRVQADMAPDSDVETLRIIVWNRHGRVEVSRVFGTLRDAGPFENVLLRVLVTDGDHLQHFEVFDVGDADPALARFAELCADRP